MSSNYTDERAEFVAGLRAFADLVESDPTIPAFDADAGVTTYVHHYRTGLSEDERFALVHDFADAHGVEVTESSAGNRAAEKRFGPVLLRVVAFADKRTERRTVTRPGTASRTKRPESATL